MIRDARQESKWFHRALGRPPGSTTTIPMANHNRPHDADGTPQPPGEGASPYGAIPILGRRQQAIRVIMLESTLVTNSAKEFDDFLRRSGLRRSSGAGLGRQR